MNRDTELLKIQVYVGYWHSHFRARISLVFGALVAVLISLVGLFYQNEIGAVTYYASVFVVFPIFAYYAWSVYRDYKRSLGKVDGMIDHVDKGNSLPSIKDMLKGKGI